MTRILIITDIHYASDAERQRGDYESRTVSNPWMRFLLKQYRHFLWRKDTFGWNHFLDRFIERAGQADCVIGNGDYCCDSGFIGVADDPSMESAGACLHQLRGAFGEKFVGIMGDHDLGKKSMFGGFGGMRLMSWNRCQGDLGLHPFFQLEFGRHVLIGMNSTLIGLPELVSDCPVSEYEEWKNLREDHLSKLKIALESIGSDQRILFFLHDPSAIPYLAELPWVRARLHQLDATFIGHLHSSVILKMSRVLAGMPKIIRMGHTALKISTALQKAKLWRPFKVQLVPAPGGIEAWKKGGYGELVLDSSREPSMQFSIKSLSSP
jgi:hypothetical protein